MPGSAPGRPAKLLLTTLIEEAEVESRDELAILLVSVTHQTQRLSFVPDSLLQNNKMGERMPVTFLQHKTPHTGHGQSDNS